MTTYMNKVAQGLCLFLFVELMSCKADLLIRPRINNDRHRTEPYLEANAVSFPNLMLDNAILTSASL
ncbi:hypothetical protein [Bradyrhizobium yuanmingense]|uniref:hypothetical protein n=1 Tax=Bradyrhizobium yuanmingense TaxID=108015 RepID=UPI0023BA1F34|nr:hypothetical protein [Bradyrhizobium yuanmingense]